MLGNVSPKCRLTHRNTRRCFPEDSSWICVSHGCEEYIQYSGLCLRIVRKNAGVSDGHIASFFHHSGRVSKQETKRKFKSYFYHFLAWILFNPKLEALLLRIVWLHGTITQKKVVWQYLSPFVVTCIVEEVKAKIAEWQKHVAWQCIT
jgi:hypothetical protein